MKPYEIIEDVFIVGEPEITEFGSNLDDWNQSTRRLLDLDADILCEGHFGIYTTKKQVEEYIRSCRRQYGVD